MSTAQQDLLFHAERLTGLGGSDIGALYNFDYGCRRKLSYEKSGTKPDFPRDEKPEFERGHYMEEPCALLYAARTKRTVEKTAFSRRADKPHMIVHMDRVIHAPEHAGPGYLEIKCVNWRTFKKWKREGIASYIILQVQHGLAVTGFQWGSYAILCLDPWDFMWADVERDPELISKLESDEEQFMSNLDLGLIPDKLPAKDKRCSSCVFRASCQGSEMLSVIPQSERDEELPERQDLAPLAYEIKELEAMADDVNELLDTAKKNMSESIAEGPGARFSGGRFLKIRPRAHASWDGKELDKLFLKDPFQAFVTLRDRLEDDIALNLIDHDQIVLVANTLRELLATYKPMGLPPKPHVRGYWTGDK